MAGRCTNVVLGFQEPHTGQARVMDCQTRHRILRCGRRWGKSAYGEIEAEVEAGTKAKRFVGLFTPQMMYLAETWRSLRHRLKPLIYRANDSQHRIEMLNGSVIEAWTLENNPEAGRSRKYHLAIIDEAGLIPGFKRWWDACLEATLIDLSGRALVLGTPHTAGPDFDEMFEKAETGADPDWAAFTGKTFDNEFLPSSEKSKILAKRTSMPDWLWLQEYEAIPADGASGFFPRSIIKAHKEANACDPVRRGDILVDAPNETEAAIVLEKRDVARIKWVDDPRGPWKLWTDLDGERPPQDAAWCAGIDIGAGVGAANSVISVGDADTGCKWAEYAAAGVTPERLAPAAAAAGIWFGGRKRNTLIQFEVNGPGEVFIRTLLRLKYPMILGHQIDPGDLSHTPSDYGWRSSDQTKNTLLADYRGALAHGKYRNPSEDALNECFTYRFAKSGRLVSIADDANTMDEARVPHGDRVISDSLCWDAMKRVPLLKVPEWMPEDKASLAYRVLAAAKAKKGKKRLSY